MSESLESTDAGIDLWRVQLGNGEIRAMSLDALDDAFQAGTIDEGTPVLAPGSTSWAKLADAAGLDAAPNAESAVHSVAPIAVSLDPHPTGQATRFAMPEASSPSPADFDLDSLEPGAFKAKKGRVFVGIGLAVMFVGGLGFAATRLAPVTSSAANALSAEAARKAAAAAPQAVEETAADIRLKALTEEQRVKLLEADKAREAREAAKKRDRPPPPPRRSGPQPKSGTPFVNGGNKYDPLNGAL